MTNPFSEYQLDKLPRFCVLIISTSNDCHSIYQYVTSYKSKKEIKDKQQDDNLVIYDITKTNFFKSLDPEYINCFPSYIIIDWVRNLMMRRIIENNKFTLFLVDKIESVPKMLRDFVTVVAMDS